MAETEFVMVYCYDITNTRRRRRVAELLQQHAVRVQRSVFEIRQTRTQADHLIARLRAELAPEDALRVYALSATGLAHTRTQGGCPLPEPGAYWLL
jgi:CRISPR-associated protein Cas2